MISANSLQKYWYVCFHGCYPKIVNKVTPGFSHYGPYYTFGSVKNALIEALKKGIQLKWEEALDLENQLEHARQIEPEDI